MGVASYVALFGGLAAQLGVLAVLSHMSKLTTQSIGTTAAAFFLSMGVYFVIDVLWVGLIEMRMLNYFYDKHSFPRPKLTRPALIAVFFLFAAAANTIVVVLPTLDNAKDQSPDYWSAALRAFVLGNFAYGNLALVQAWSFPGFPVELIGTLPLSGGALSVASSVTTVAVVHSQM